MAGVAARHADGALELVGGLLDPLFSGTYAVPKLALFPIFIFVFGLGSLSKVALVFLECLYPIDDHHLPRRAQREPRAASGRRRTWAPRARATLARVVIPAIAPYIFAGLRVALPVALIVVMITEMISSVDGLGYLVIYSLSSLKTDRMLAVVVVIVAARPGCSTARSWRCETGWYTGKSSTRITSEEDRRETHPFALSPAFACARCRRAGARP